MPLFYFLVYSIHGAVQCRKILYVRHLVYTRNVITLGPQWLYVTISLLTKSNKAICMYVYFRPAATAIEKFSTSCYFLLSLLSEDRISIQSELIWALLGMCRATMPRLQCLKTLTCQSIYLPKVSHLDENPSLRRAFFTIAPISQRRCWLPTYDVRTFVWQKLRVL